MRIPSLAAAIFAALASADAVDAAGKLLLRVVDAETKAEIPFRFHLRNEKQVPVKVPKLPFWHDHVVVPGKVELELFRGNYFFEIEHGPEYVNATGYFTIHDGADDEKTVELKHPVDMAAAGWWSGDLDVRRPLRELELAMQADDVHVVPLATWSNRRSDWTGKTKPPAEPAVRFDANRYYHALGGADDRNGGPIHLFNLPEPAALPNSSAPLVALMPQLAELKAKQPKLWIDVADAAAWDLPVLAARGLVDSVCVLSPQLRRDKVEPSPGLRPFDKSRYLPATAPAEFAQDVYFHLLNCGLRIAPSAGSGSGTVGNPVGYNRVYVQVPTSKFHYESWWQGLADGRAVVTNGPSMRPRANDAPPGFVFAARSGESEVAVELTMDLTTRDPISYVEVIRNGQVVQNRALRDWAKNGRFSPVLFQESGWCAIRARCDTPKTYRMALSAPWYVEFDGKPRVSRASAQFFLDWIEERAATLKIVDPEQRKTADAELEQARAFWKKLVAEANAP